MWADEEIVPSERAKVTAGLFDRFNAGRPARAEGGFGRVLSRPVTNTDVLNGYRDIGVELLQQIKSIDAFSRIGWSFS